MVTAFSDVDPKAPMPIKENAEVVANDQTKPFGGIFPSVQDKLRLANYSFYESLFMGDHFDAFNIHISDEKYARAWKKLRYTAVNFAGLMSKIVADFLFSEPVRLVIPDDGDDEFIIGLWKNNHLDTQLYESALSNSYNGDALFKLRIGNREAYDTTPELIIEDNSPGVYFPIIDSFNPRQNPKTQYLAWKFKVSGADYLRIEKHESGVIYNEVWKIQEDRIKSKMPISLLNDPDLKEVEQTNVEFIPIEHVPNWKTGNRYFGISDYYDLTSLFFSLNNRMSKLDNILDKHSDPILTVPPGVLDEKGNVKKSQLGVIEIQEGESGKPEYVVWDASLENAFKQIEKLVEFMYMVGEVSPDVLGLGQGVSDSGRALKFKLMRTLAKVQRKKLYYDTCIKNMLYKAQVLAKENGVMVNGKRLSKEPVMVDIEWQDGLPVDMTELIEQETLLVDAGLKSKLDSVQTIHNVEEDQAQKMLDQISKEDKMSIRMNPMHSGANFNQEE